MNLASPAVPDNVLASPVSGETVETESVLSKPMSMIQIIRMCSSFSWGIIITCLSSARVRKVRQIEKGVKNIISEGIQPSAQKKVKSRMPRDDIDDIFSFTK